MLNCGLKKYGSGPRLLKIEEQIEAGFHPGLPFAYFKDNQWTEFYLGQSDPEHDFD